MPRENCEAKGRRLLTEGRLTVVLALPSHYVAAECKGDSGEVYTLGYEPVFKRWDCTCPALGKRCSHLVALKLVVAV